ncbi:MAG: hypothetical protein AAB443_03165 [Patescibacteria group bacterium]
MQILQDSKQVKDLIYEGKKIAVIPSPTSGIDGFCASGALYKVLKNTNKDVILIYSSPIPEELKEFLSHEDITPIPTDRDFIISIDFSGTRIERVNWAVDGDICKVVLTPVSKDFDSSKITYENIGLDYDLVISIGAKAWKDHTALYAEFENDLKKLYAINIDNSHVNTNFATINVVEPQASSMCHLLLHKLVSWNFRITEDVAKLLLIGMTSKKLQKTE